MHFFLWISYEILCFTKIFLWTWQLHEENPRTSSFFHILSIQKKNHLSLNPWKVQVHHAFSWRTFMFSCVGCEIWMSSLIFFRNSNVILRFQMKNCVLIFREMDLHVTSPTRDHFFISRRACDNVSLHIFDFMVFLFQNCFCNLHPIQELLVRASVARGQGSGLSAQKRFCLCLACFPLPSLKTMRSLVTSPAGDEIFCHQKRLHSCQTWNCSNLKKHRNS